MMAPEQGGSSIPPQVLNMLQTTQGLDLPTLM
jgi:hypothetical protein